MTSPLDYASPAAAKAKPAITPAQRRRRRVLVIALILCFVPYPTTVFPRLTVRFVDGAGRAVDCSHPIQWRGYTNAGDVEGVFRCDPGGQLRLPSRRVWASPASRLLALLGGFVPHSGGWSSTRASVWFDLADDEAVDEEAMGGLTTSVFGVPGCSLGQPGDVLRVTPSSSSGR